MPRVESISKPKIERRINSTKYIQNLLPPKNSYKMKRSICIFSDPTQLISRKSMQPNHQTKTHRPNLNSNTNLGQPSSSVFVILSSLYRGCALLRISTAKRTTTPPKRLYLIDARANPSPRKSHIPRGDCYFIYTTWRGFRRFLDDRKLVR